MNRERLRLLLLGIGCGIMAGIGDYSRIDTLPAGEIMNFLAYGRFEITLSCSYEFLVAYFPWILLQAVLGIFLYRHFCTASVYFFPRLQNRFRWFVKESLEMFLYVLLYVMVFTASAILMVGASVEVTIGEADMWLIASFVATHVLWVYAMTLLVNVLSILWGSSAGFMSAIGIQLAMLAYYVVFDRYLEFVPNEEGLIENLEQKSLLLQLNPLSHLILKWHSGEIGELQVYGNEFGIDFPMWCSLVLFAVIAVVVWVAGAIIVKKQDFVTINRETNGV